MILKEADDRSGDIAELKRLKDTSPPRFHATIQKQIADIYAGLEGERSAAHFINREYRHSEKMLVLHDLRIGVDEDYAQIDHLVIHRFQRVAWVLETKNYSGRLSCDEHGDWTVWYGRKPQPIPSPVNQARRHCETLRLWLKANVTDAIGDIRPVVLISPTSSVNRTRLPPDAHIVKSDNFVEWWNKQADKIGVGTALGVMGRHMASGLSHDGFVDLGEHLASAHIPTRYDWRAMLRLPHAPEPSEHSQVRPAGEDALISEVESSAGPQIISTRHGDIRIIRIPDGRYALRNDKNDALIEIVKSACKGKAQWNPRFRNWLVSEEDLPCILAAIEK